MSWQSYVESMMSDGQCMDAAVVGFKDNKSVWASFKGGSFANITVPEIDKLVSGDRNALCLNGLTIGNEKCSVLRDSLKTDGEWTMDLRTKCANGGATYNIAVCQTGQVLIMVKGKEGVHGGKLNQIAFGIGDHLRKSGY